MRTLMQETLNDLSEKDNTINKAAKVIDTLRTEVAYSFSMAYL